LPLQGISPRPARYVPLRLCAITYAALFGILRSEQNALLLGSLLLFVALAGLMLGTRRIDWYRLGKQPEAVAA
jgi:inner membrane protein